MGYDRADINSGSFLSSSLSSPLLYFIVCSSLPSSFPLLFTVNSLHTFGRSGFVIIVHLAVSPLVAICRVHISLGLQALLTASQTCRAHRSEARE